MIGERLDVRTTDGVMDCYTFVPAPGAGSNAGGAARVSAWPVVIVYMDAFGIRDQLGHMAQRLASNGYFVALPNLYYRTSGFQPFDREAVLAEGPERTRFRSMIESINGPMVMRDTSALLDALEGRPGVVSGAIGVVGYCMGGGYALSAAATFPDRVEAAASIHGGWLATDKPDSPHRLAGRMRARIYVGAAAIDPTFPREQHERLDTAFRDAGLAYTIETYEGARHGFAVLGHLAYDHEAAERHWTRLLAFLGDALH